MQLHVFDYLFFPPTHNVEALFAHYPLHKLLGHIENSQVWWWNDQFANLWQPKWQESQPQLCNSSLHSSSTHAESLDTPHLTLPPASIHSSATWEKHKGSSSEGVSCDSSDHHKADSHQGPFSHLSSVWERLGLEVSESWLLKSSIWDETGGWQLWKRLQEWQPWNSQVRSLAPDLALLYWFL